jgi:hypothetical protein
MCEIVASPVQASLSIPARENGSMTRYHRRLAALEKALTPPAVEDAIVQVALNTGQGDYMFNGREWLPCPKARALLARSDLPIKVCTGMTLAALIGPTGQGPPKPAERPRDDDP